MSFPASRLILCVSLVALIAPGGVAQARDARDLIHRIPAISAQRVPDIIVQFPPLRPAAEPEELSLAPQPRTVPSPPTLEEAPLSAHDAPRTAEDAPQTVRDAPSLPAREPPLADVPLRLSGAEPIASTSAPSEVALNLPAPVSAPLVQWMNDPRAERRAACAAGFVEQLRGGLTGRPGRTVLDDFLPCATAEAARVADAATPAPPLDAPDGAKERLTYLMVAAAGLGVLTLFGYVGHSRRRARAAARLSAMNGASSTAEFRAVAQMPSLKSPLTRLREFFDWLLISVGGLRRGAGVPAPSPAVASAAPASTLVKVAALMRGSSREEPPAPPVDLTRILRTTRTPVIGATALAETMIEPLHDGVETQLQTMQLNGEAMAVVAPAPLAAPVQPEDRDADAADDLVLVEPGDAVAASAAINAARLRLEAER